MKKFWVLLSIFIFSTTIFGAARTVRQSNTAQVPATLNQHLTPQGEEIIPEPGVGGPAYLPSTREDNVVLVDSSLNGYGMLVGETNPLSWDPVNNRFLLAYRQWAGETGSSGVIGAALSEDGGSSFFTYSNLNAGVGVQQAGRYPSAFATPNFPMIIWNEYGGGGGDYGGRAYYTYDEGEYGGEIFAPPADLHTNPTANDIWQGSPNVNYDETDNMYVNASFADWTDPRNKYLFRATTAGTWNGTPLAWEPAVVLVDQAREFLGDAASNYTSNGTLNINDNGVGYFVVSGYWNDTLAIANHTLFMKQTTDYGDTWSDWHYIPDEVLNDYFWEVFPDSIWDESSNDWAVLDPDWTPFVNYDLDVMVDDDGGCHIVAGVLPSATGGVYPGWSEYNGLYHFYSPQDDLLNWDINPIGSLQSAWLLEDPGWQGVFPTIARDNALDSTLYVSWYTWPDTSSDIAYMDVMAVFSEDNGATWSDPINISDTEDPALDEIDPHFATLASNGTVYMVYQMPDFDVPTVNPPASSEDYKCRIYFRSYTFPVSGTDVADEGRVRPDGFMLDQNYPNPFNPTTTLAFDLPVNGQVQLAVYDLMGREVANLVNGYMTAGHHEVRFDASNLASGMYFYKMNAGSYSAVRKMMLMK
ncbi:MAG: T9SS type A sorting domain-containing protein [Lentisphaeria bacterium]|nr:T9SS type A sorting domain-containing protein [Candidatus Neomarinimicrobiota bacterium]MCF7843239.1 T9SS type A sorting domain-containing protein [Lentisphaeria bacterium]